MNKLLAALFIAVAVQASVVLAGSHNAGRTQFPHQAWLNVTTEDGKHRHCAGALIAPQWILTSSACVADVFNIRVYLGTFYHPIQVQGSMHDSIALQIVWSESNGLGLVQMLNSPTQTDYVATIRLPPKSYATSSHLLWKTTVSEYAVSRHGKVSLVYSNARVEPNFLCRRQYKSFSDDNICLLSLWPAHEAKTCTRDAGSPLIVKDSDGKPTLLGIATAFKGTTSSCGTVFTKIAPHLDWISETMATNPQLIR